MQLKHLLSALFLFSSACASAQQAGASGNPDASQVPLLREGRSLIDAGRPTEAIPRFEQVLGYFEAKYGDSRKRIYSAQNSTERMGYLLLAAGDNAQGKA